MRAPSPLDVTSPTAPVPAPVGGEIATVEQLGDAIADLAARIHAATYELLVLIRQFDTRTGWNNGFASCAHWLSWRTGIDLGACREKVRVAHALAVLPQISAAMQRGALSYAKVRALSRVATPATETQLLNAARACTAAQVERLVRAWRRVDRIAAAQEATRQYLHRELYTYVDDDGMVIIRGRLAPEVGTVVQRALEAAADRLYRESAQTFAPDRIEEEVTPAQRRADALGLVAESALAADLDRGTAGDRYQVVLHVEADALQSGEAGQAALDEPRGQHVSAETSRRLACDASVVVMQHAADGSVLDVGRRRRTIPPAIRRALTARDQRCRFPGCAARAHHCDAHHVEQWGDGGATRLDRISRNVLPAVREQYARRCANHGRGMGGDPADFVIARHTLPVRPVAHPSSPASVYESGTDRITAIPSTTWRARERSRKRPSSVLPFRRDRLALTPPRSR